MGPGLFGTLTNEPNNHAAYAHNVFLDAAVELGIAGALALIAVLLIGLKAAIRRRQDLVVALLTAFLAASMFDDVLYFPRNGLLLAVAFALLAVPMEAEPEAEPADVAEWPRGLSPGEVPPQAREPAREPLGSGL